MTSIIENQNNALRIAISLGIWSFLSAVEVNSLHAGKFYIFFVVC